MKKDKVFCERVVFPRFDMDVETLRAFNPRLEIKKNVFVAGDDKPCVTFEARRLMMNREKRRRTRSYPS